MVDTNVPENEQSVDEEETDGMGISFVNEEDCGYFGMSTKSASVMHQTSLRR